MSSPPPPRPSSPASEPPWVVLRLKACVDPDLPQAGCLARGLRPPGITELFVSPLVDSSSRALVPDPVVLAADSSGILLLSGSPDDNPEKTVYFLCNAVSNTVRQLPDMPGCTGAAGLTVSPGGDDFMVTELVCPSSISDTATLHCFCSDGSWIHKTPHPDLPLVRYPWCTDRVFSYIGKLWWADFSQGLLTCDPLSAEPNLQFVPFPNLTRNMRMMRLFGGPRIRRDPSSERCVGISGGKLRYMVLTTRGRFPRIKLWTLVDPETDNWTLDYNLSFKDIWDDPTYNRFGLLNRLPALALVHPNDPQVVYFFEREHIYGFNMRMKTATEGTLSDIGIDEASSAFILAWQLPPSLKISPGHFPCAFDRLAASFGDASDAAIAAMESRQFMNLALADLNKNIKKEENRFKISELICICYFDDIADNEKVEYAHLNFRAHNGAKEILVFAELVNSGNGCNSWTLSSCKAITKNSHGGLRDENVDVAQEKGTRKRKRSLYCFACEGEMKHPKGGFNGGHGLATGY